MRKLAPLTVFLALGVSSLLATALVPRKSPELKFLDPSGKETRLSSFKGKVVVIEFLLANCPHCQRVARTINKLYSELGPRGFQPIGIVFDNGISGPVVTNFVHDFKITFPVGYTSSDKVDIYLGRAATERFQVPQMVVIDRAGVIRAQSPGRGDPNLEDENYLRNLINSLLNKSAPAHRTKKTTFPPKKIS
jgi:peroxiredoxin